MRVLFRSADLSTEVSNSASVTAARLPTVIPFWFPGCPGWKLGPTPAVAWGVSGGTRRCGGSFPPAPTVGARPGSGAGGQDLLGDCGGLDRACALGRGVVQIGDVALGVQGRGAARARGGDRLAVVVVEIGRAQV